MALHYEVTRLKETIEEGREKGRKEGIQQGIENGIQKSIEKMLVKNMKDEDIASILELNIEVVNKVKKNID